MTTSIATQLSAGTWTADAVHSDISFKVRHMGVGKARAPSTSRPPPSRSARAARRRAVTAEIDAASVETKQEQRNAHVKSPDFLDVENHPILTFVSTGMKDFDGDDFVLVGDLTIRDTTRRSSWPSSSSARARTPTATPAPASAPPPRSAARPTA